MLINPFGAGLAWSAVRSWRRGKADVDIVMRDGDTIRVEVGAFDHAVECLVQASFPAPPGTQVCIPLHDTPDHVDSIELWPALGFVVNGMGAVHPVTMQGIQTEAVICHPDGRVEGFQEDWPDVDAYRASLNEKGRAG